MVHLRTILTLSIAILAINNVLVEAGQATKDRIKNLKNRAETHKDALRTHEDAFKKKFGSMTEQVINQLTEISDIIIDRIMIHKTFPEYLKNVFLILRKYAVRQIKSRYNKLNKIHKKWEKENFPDKKMKANALKILKKQEKESAALQKNNENKSKANDKKLADKNGGQKKK